MLASGRRLGAYIGLSGWLPLREQIGRCHALKDLDNFFRRELGLKGSVSTEQSSMLGTPILLGHTTDDEVIDIELGRQASEVLQNLGMRVTWKEFPDGGHLGMLKTEGLDSIVTFLDELVNM